MIIVPVRNMVLFPGVALPVSLGRPGSIAAAQEATARERKVGFLLQRDSGVDEPGPNDLHRIGTIASVLRYVTSQDGTHHLVCQGERRFKIVEFLHGQPFMTARIEWLEDSNSVSPEVDARLHYLKQQASEAVQLLPQAPREMLAAIQSISSASAMADLVANFLDLEASEKQELIETTDVKRRLDIVLEKLSRQVEVLRLSQEIDKQTKEAMDERQREILLREQLKAIQKELGSDGGSEISDLEEAITKADMPTEVEEHARKELKRLQAMPDGAMEHSMLTTYLEWLAALPWSVMDDDSIDIAKAREILDEDHYGLEKVKKRILEYLAVRKLNPEGRSPILCFVGPPGVGKTSLGRSIARALALKFARVSLGGVHDEAEIRGHRRTYVGALPGNIIQALRKAGSRNPVFMLDEIDKLGAGGFHGDPSSAMLEVLDPEQNDTFRDNYLGVPFDLNKVMFVATANVLDTIPGPLRDRMEIIELPGYTQEEKVQIAKRYLVRRQLEENGISAEQADITDDALRAIVQDYTREAGCRNLERQIGSVMRHVAVRVSEGSVESVRVDAKDLHEILGPRKFENEVAMRTSVPGVATGLAWTPVGGDILFVETSKTPGSGKLILTGQLGDVMKESAQAALSLVKSRLHKLGLSAGELQASDIHIHVPAGAIPKDGPSAGVAIFLSLVSLLTNKTVRNDVAMTGEISLRGLVLPVGGVKEKSLAALRAGIKTVMLPKRNEKDLEEIPESARTELKFVWLEHVDDAIDAALDGRPTLEERAKTDEAMLA